MEEVRYYNSPISLEEAEQYIQSGLITAARAYVANGYYLHRIREDKLFEEAGYQNFEDYVRGKYNKDKGWASKCIKVNQQLSEGGDSPILSKQYLEYSIYQLVELAYMSEEQREEAAPDMTVNQLKQIRKPEEAVEPEKSCDVATSEPEEKEQDPEETQKSGVYHFLDKHESIDDAYGWIRSEMVKEYLKNGYKSPDKEYEAVVFGNAHKVLKRENVTVFHDISGAALFDVENARLEREYKFYVKDQEPDQGPGEVTEIISLEESESKDPPNTIEELENVPERPETVPDHHETVIDGEYEEILSEPEHVKPAQPELPILKNNDQRKEFINAYEAWPIWIDQKETGERYYRYDLSDKVAMVVKVSWKHSWKSYKKSKDYEYGAEQYYLLGVKSECSANLRSIYVEDETRTFYECSTNMTALVEYLKEFQKKGKGENHVEN